MTGERGDRVERGSCVPTQALLSIQDVDVEDEVEDKDEK